MNATQRPVVVHADGTVTIRLTHKQLLALETYAAQPSWPVAASEALKVLREVRL